MARPNPYQMDPYLSQGFSSLTKALIGDPETDYQVSRTNRINELLPLEKQQIQAQIGNSDAGASAARALATLRKAQTLTEDERRDPLVQLDIAKAKAELGLAASRNADADQTKALTPSMIAENDANAKSSLAQAFKFTQAGDQTKALTPSMIAENDAAAKSLLAQAFKFTQAGDQTKALTPSMIAENDAKAAEYSSAAELNKAKAEAEGRVILNAGQTIQTTNAAGEVETYTAPKQAEVILEPGEEAVIIDANGVQTRITGPAGTGKVKSVSASATKFLVETIETELNLSELEIPRSIRMEVRGDAANFIQENGNTEAAATFIANALKPVVITEGSFFSIGEFSTAQYVLDQIEAVKEAAQNPSAVPGAILTMLTTDYGYSEDQAKAIMAYANI